MTMQTRALPIGMMVTTGNQAQVSQAQIAEALLDDPRITAIGLHVEGFGDLRQWEALATKAHARSVPLVALKVGISTHAQSAAISHTASLAGADEGAQAFLDRLGILRAPDIPAFLETLKLLHVAGRLSSTKIAAICCSGGEASLVADMAHDTALTFPKLTFAQEQSLLSTLGPKVALANPLDYHTYIWRDEDAMTAAWSAMTGPDIALTLVVLDYPRPDRCDAADWACATNAAQRMRRDTGRPVAVAATLPELMPEAIAQQFIAGGVVPLHGLSEALCAIDLAARPAHAPPDAPVFRCDPPFASETLSETASKEVLAAHGLAVPASVITNHGAGGVDDLQFPVAVKADGLAHKTDFGGVVLDCRSVAEVQDAMDSMGDISSFRVEEMCPGGPEILIGVTHDPAHGYLLTLGAGGTLAELLRDTQTLLIPSDAASIEQALNRLKMAPLLHGYRGAVASNIAAIVDAALAVQAYVMAENGRVWEVEVNPLICGPDTAIAADALIRRTP